MKIQRKVDIFPLLRVLAVPARFFILGSASGDLLRQNFIKTFLEKDIGLLGVRVPPMQLWRFWRMVEKVMTFISGQHTVVLRLIWLWKSEDNAGALKLNLQMLPEKRALWSSPPRISSSIETLCRLSRKAVLLYRG